MYERCLCVPTDSAVKTELLTEAHSSPFSMHPGRLPRTLKGYTVIWVVVDRLTKLLTLFDGNPLTLPLALGTRLDFSTAFHPQTDGQIERLNRILEDMLRACVLEFSGSCVIDLLYVGVKLSRHKSYADEQRKDLEFDVGDMVFLKVAPMKGVLRFEKKEKLSPRFVGPFEILERIGLVAYCLALPPAFSVVHDVFYFSMLRKEVKMLRNRGIALVKVLSRNHGVAEAIWEREDDMRAQYPKLCED
ncbi:pol protein [Cucumis melo var. makuwa]|uniref:Pol protein n=1 Tax=Cucumis melo var. makuwa TaxID=1194695 RepID=A0A5A7TEP9_CUCMM|nr:pol protein [Cucumis melo var. makuwa]